MIALMTKNQIGSGFLFGIIIFLAPYVAFAAPQPSFFAYQSADQTIGTGATSSLDTLLFDYSSGYNTTTHKFQPTTAGQYIITFTLRCLVTITGDCTATIDKNGAPLINSLISILSSDTGGNAVVANAVVDFNGTTDYVSFACYIFATIAVVNAGNTVFSGALVRSA